MASLLRFAPILNFLSHAEVAAAKATDCASLLGYTFSNGTASVVLATDIPQGINFSSSDSLTTYDLPNFCRIALHIQTSPETTATAEVWLPPPDAWNTRLLTVGNGGFAGSSTGGRQGLAALDGVADGVIMGPSRCAFQPETLLCGQKNDTNTNNAAASCLTHDQVLKLERLYRPWLTNDGQILNPGLSPGGEASLATLMNSPEPLFGPAFYRNAVYNDTTWDWRHLSPTDIALGDSVNSGGANAYDPDLRPFEVRGGKVLHYHGCADPLIPSLNAAAWYDEVHRFYADTVGRAGDVEKFYRLFMVPGMGHCSGGAGAWALDGAGQGDLPLTANDSLHSLLYSLVDWVEGAAGTARTNIAVAMAMNVSAPESIIGTSSSTKRPLSVSISPGLSADGLRPPSTTA